MSHNPAASKPAVSKVTEQAFHFLISTDTERPNAESRRLIRSRVMLGKNKGRILPPRKRQAQITHHKQTLPSTSKPSISPAAPSTSSSLSPPIPLSHIPRKFGSDLTSIPLPAAIDPESVQVLLNFSTLAKTLLFPLSPIILFTSRAAQWVAPLMHDSAYLHCMLFSALFYFQVLRPNYLPCATCQQAMPHYVKTLRILQDRLAGAGGDEKKISDTTVVCVMALAGHALLTGDERTSRQHIQGLEKIVRLRGGIASFIENTKLLVEVLRCDIGLSLRAGTPPIFFQPITGESIPPYPDLTIYLDSPPTSIPFSGINKHLALAYLTLHNFTAVINLAASTSQRITTDLYLESMSSIMYRLLQLKFLRSSIEETIRLALLAYAGSAFLQWRTLGMSYNYLASSYKASLLALMSSSCSGAASPRLKLWLLILGAVSVFDEKDEVWLHPLLRNSIRACDVDNWMQVKALLVGSMWIPLIHDRLGKEVFDCAMRGWDMEAEATDQVDV